ncbi:hypothetical protein CY35_03G038300 [Sphagnum magellanicum]|nr:hypothetical protein CY35_03G038300 [Sphagnum magellanicum]
MGSTTKHKSVKRKPPMCLPSSSMAAVSGVRDVGKKVVIQELEGGGGGGGRIAVPAAGGDASGSCSETEPRRCGASDEGSDYDSESPNHAAFQGKLAAGAKEDEVLQHAEALTIEEVVRRRSRRVRQLMKLYKAQYWGLLEEMRSKYRRFYLRHGKSGWRDDTESGEQQRGGGDDGEAAIYGREREGVSPSGTEGGGMREPHAPERTGSETLRCGAQGCLAKPLPLSIFCYEHILLEPRQRLYRPCSFVVRRSRDMCSGQNGTVTCSKPVLCAVSPPLCGIHYQQAQKQAARSLRKAGLVLPPGLAAKPPPKLHYFIAEYVRIIQSKRCALRAAALRAATSRCASIEDTAEKKSVIAPPGIVVLPKQSMKPGPSGPPKISVLKKD